MDPVHVVPLITDFNRNSLAILAGALETTPATAKCPITPVQGMDALLDALPDICARTQQAVAAFSFGTLELIDSAHAVRRLRTFLHDERLDNVTTIAGGPHTSAAPEETLKLGVDYVVVGEGEIAFPAFVRAVGDGTDPLSVKGVAALRNGQVVRNGRGERPDVNAYPPIARRTMLFSYIEITRGCARACKFCHNTFFFGRALRHRSIANIEASVQFLHDVGRRDIHFLSPDALSYGSTDPDRPDLRAIEELLRAASHIVGRDHTFYGSFPSEVWPASVTGEGLEIIRAHTGNDKIIVGAQSGSQAMLDRMNRTHTVEDVINAVRLIAEHGFVPSVDFLFGLPHATESDEQATIDLMFRLADMGAQIHSHTFIPLPGTPLADYPPPRLSMRLQKALDQLAGPGKQYGSWRRQLHMAHQITAFRRQLQAAKCIDDLDLDAFCH
ncbi:MAG: TIGR04013 family B12-binding domain/radical SAM domain-containing protein [Planctomycetes bacterium]|nr:TIGR04013 family B12-binding domain/radical SAM domain-containing protein [Planctomycetota bacterium]